MLLSISSFINVDSPRSKGSGVFEILGGIGLLIPSVSVAAAWGLIALFIAVFPANIYMALHNVKLDGLPQSQLLYWGRLPLQAVLIAWV